MKEKEEKLISLFRKHITFREKLELRDDAGLIELGKNKLVVSTDTLFRKTHFPEEMSMFQMGRKAVIISLSDIASMGAKPLGMSLSVSVSGLTEQEMESLAKGINSACYEYDAKLLKGDTKNFGELYISTTAVGICNNRVLTRSGAKKGDAVCVTGTIGDAACGLLILLKKKKYHSDYLVKRALEPKAKIDEGIILSKFANSCMDISDGFFWSLSEIAKQSNVGMKIDPEKIPLSKECRSFLIDKKLRMNDIAWVGEDFELIFTIPKEDVKKLEMDFSVIGEVTEEKEVYLGDEVMPKYGYSTF